MKKYLLSWFMVAALGLSVLPASAQIVYREVMATGNGGDVSSATVDALETAISQVGGMKLSSFSSLSIGESTQGNTTQSSEEFRQKIEKLTRGVVKSYTIIESGTTPTSGRAFVKIRAVIPTYKTSAQLKRLKIAVMPLEITGALRTQQDARSFSESVSAALEAYLTQSRKFAIIDRRYTESADRELRKANSRNAPIEESVKIGVRAGADYIVLAALKEFSATQSDQQRATGRVARRITAPVSIDVRVLDIATGQVKFAQSYINPGKLPSGMSLSQYAVDIGADVGQVISTAIYPIAVVSVNGSTLTFNQGGETVQVGRIYRLVNLGKNLIDPYTKESLGLEEIEVAQAEVTSVTDRTASARVITGAVPSSSKPGSILARLMADDMGALPNTQDLVRKLPGAKLPGDSSSGKSKKSDDDDW